MAEIDHIAQEGLKCLRQAVAEALERKRKLGQYAVFWRDGRVVFEGPDAPSRPPDPDLSNGFDQDAPSPES